MALSLLTACVLLAPPSQEAVPLQAIARVNHPPIAEMSGIVKSRRYAGVYWVHNDSGDSARIFAIGLDGKPIIPEHRKKDAHEDQNPTGKVFEGIRIEGATNIDWEDIAIDGDTLYIADMGNNGNARRDLGVYVVKEPNPNSVDRTRALRFVPVAYPAQTEFPPKEQWNYDCEAVFVYGGKLHFLTKHRRGSVMPVDSTVLWRLDSQDSGKINPLKRVESRGNLGGWVTAADLSPDGKTLAVLCNAPRAAVWLFTAGKGGTFLSNPAKVLWISGVNQAEAIAWADANTIVITNEQREIFKVNRSQFYNAK
jgi:hypothetical protein